MRLSARQAAVIKEEVRNVFGPEATVRLFGSRVDDEAKGGDIDLFIEADIPPQEKLDLELTFRARLVQRLGDQRIDVVMHRPGTPDKTIDQEARLTGIPL